MARCCSHRLWLWVYTLAGISALHSVHAWSFSILDALVAPMHTTAEPVGVVPSCADSTSAWCKQQARTVDRLLDQLNQAKMVNGRLREDALRRQYHKPFLITVDGTRWQVGSASLAVVCFMFAVCAQSSKLQLIKKHKQLQKLVQLKEAQWKQSITTMEQLSKFIKAKSLPRTALEVVHEEVSARPCMCLCALHASPMLSYLEPCGCVPCETYVAPVTCSIVASTLLRRSPSV